MRVFLAGATGVIGRRLLPMLIESGHDVVAMTRSEERTAALRERGAEPVVADALDPDGLDAALDAARPEAVVHQLTDLPSFIDPRRAAEQYAPNDRLRREGTANLVRAAHRAGARRIVSQSIAFAYAPGPGLAGESDPLYTDAPDPWDRSVAAVQALEDTTLGRGDSALPEGVVLRYGFFYGPDTAYARDGGIAKQVAARRFPVVGRGEGVFSFVHVDDAARAAVAALERGDGILNVVDDDPAPMREWLPAYAEALGAKRPIRVPRFLARIVAGRFTLVLATELRGASNERARSTLGWRPHHGSWRSGFRESLG